MQDQNEKGLKKFYDGTGNCQESIMRAAKEEMSLIEESSS